MLGVLYTGQAYYIRAPIHSGALRGQRSHDNVSGVSRECVTSRGDFREPLHCIGARLQRLYFTNSPCAAISAYGGHTDAQLAAMCAFAVKWEKMKNMSNQEYPEAEPEINLEMIEEFLEQQEQRPYTPLPGPRPPPNNTHQQEARLVARGSPQHHSLVAMATPVSQQACSGNRSCTSHRSRTSQNRVPNRNQNQNLGMEHLERLLDVPQLVIMEQPKERGMRFRYECEGRSAGSILGASSTETNKIPPAVELHGNLAQVKCVKITVSLVTKDVPHRPHPHSLVGKDCHDGVCVVRLSPRSSTKHSFNNLGIQCVRRKEMDHALEKRKKQNVDPFGTGCMKSISDIDMNVVRLCFQCEVEMEDGEKTLLSPLVSNPIYDKKATTTSELKISRLNIVRGPCTGKTEIYLLCDKVQKDDIEIIFSHDGWEAKAEFAQTDVHRQIAIVFKSPPYVDQNITEEVEVNVFLRRLSDYMDSESVRFTYLPHNPDPYEVNRKRKIKTDVSFERCSVAAQHVPPTETPYEPTYTYLSDPPAMDDVYNNGPTDIHLNSDDLHLLLQLTSSLSDFNTQPYVYEEPNYNLSQDVPSVPADQGFYNDVHLHANGIPSSLLDTQAPPTCDDPAHSEVTEDGHGP